MQLKNYAGATDPDYLNLLATLAQIKNNSKRVLNQLQDLDKRIGIECRGRKDSARSNCKPEATSGLKSERRELSDENEIETISIEISKGKPLTRKELLALKSKHEFTSDLMLRSLLDAAEGTAKDIWAFKSPDCQATFEDASLTGGYSPRQHAREASPSKLAPQVENAYSKDFSLENLTKIATRIKSKHPRTADPTKGSCGNCQNWRLLPYFDIDNPDVVEGECQVLEIEGNYLKTHPSFACAKWRLLTDE